MSLKPQEKLRLEHAGTNRMHCRSLQESEIKVAALPAHLGRNMQEQIGTNIAEQTSACRTVHHYMVRAWSPRESKGLHGFFFSWCFQHARTLIFYDILWYFEKGCLGQTCSGLLGEGSGQKHRFARSIEGVLFATRKVWVLPGCKGNSDDSIWATIEIIVYVKCVIKLVSPPWLYGVSRLFTFWQCFISA